MSSQTTDTPGTTTTSAVDRSGATSQTYPITSSNANQRFRDSQHHQRGPRPQTARKTANHFQDVCQGVGRYLSASAAATRITLHAPRTRHKSTPTPTPHPQKPRHHTKNPPGPAPTPAKPAETSFCGLPHPPCRLLSAGSDWPETRLDAGLAPADLLRAAGAAAPDGGRCRTPRLGEHPCHSLDGRPLPAE